MKRVYLNELTLDNLPQQNLLLLKGFQKVLSRFIKETEVASIDKHIVIDEDTSEKLYKAIFTGSSEERNTLVSWFQRIYVGPNDDDGNRLNDCDYEMMLSPEAGVKSFAFGLAHRNRSVTLGLCPSCFWERPNPVYLVKETSIGEDGSIRTIDFDAVCITKEAQVSTLRVQDWIAANREFEEEPPPTPCAIPIEQKAIHIDDKHHGREILLDFCKQIIKHEFVEGVVDSLPFDSTTKRFRLKSYPDGTVDLRLHWTKWGLGIKVKTVARNLRQAMRIAEILEEKYDKRS